MKTSSIPEFYLNRVTEMLASKQRVILGLVGGPGAGKSTLAEALREAFADISQIVPMDGFHLANVELERLGLSACKGAPRTFDSAGYVSMLTRIRNQPADEIVYAPEFRREIEEPIANAIPVHYETRLIITEGNYLLLDDGHWDDVYPLLDEAWFVDIDPEVRRGRLASRHERFGRSRQAALDWVELTDEPNARLIDQTRDRAHRIFSWEPH